MNERKIFLDLQKLYAASEDYMHFRNVVNEIIKSEANTVLLSFQDYFDFIHSLGIGPRDGCLNNEGNPYFAFNGINIVAIRKEEVEKYKSLL